MKSTRNAGLLTILFLVGSLIINGCRTQEETAIEQSPPTDLPVPTMIPGSPIEVIYTGEECEVIGPQEVPIGSYPIILNDQSGNFAALWVAKLNDGKTFQDLLEPQTEQREYYPAPDWIEYPRRYTDADKGYSVYILDEPGEYAIYIYTPSPVVLWFCRPLFVIE